MSDFEVMGHTGGKIIIRDNNLSFHHCNFNPCSIYSIAATLDGTLVSYVPMGGIGHISKIPYGCFQILMFSDKEGLFGRKCPKCNSYFRTTTAGEKNYCPYCEHNDLIIKFITDKQSNYILAMLNELAQLIEGKKTHIEVDFDELINDFPQNMSDLVYSEEKQQKRIKCKKCNVVFDILGEFGSCPSCKSRNSLDYFIEKNLENLKKIEINDNAADLEDCLKNVVSDFEAMAKDVNSIITTYPHTNKRRADLKRINFQHIQETSEKYKNWLDIEIFENLTKADVEFILKMFNIRHLLVHNAGIVDEKYIQRTNDRSVRIKQRIRVAQEDVLKFSNLMNVVSQNIYLGFCEISSNE